MYGKQQAIILQFCTVLYCTVRSIDYNMGNIDPG